MPRHRVLRLVDLGRLSLPSARGAHDSLFTIQSSFLILQVGGFAHSRRSTLDSLPDATGPPEARQRELSPSFLAPRNVLLCISLIAEGVRMKTGISAISIL